MPGCFYIFIYLLINLLSRYLSPIRKASSTLHHFASLGPPVFSFSLLSSVVEERSFSFTNILEKKFSKMFNCSDCYFLLFFFCFSVQTICLQKNNYSPSGSLSCFRLLFFKIFYFFKAFTTSNLFYRLKNNNLEI